MCGYIRRHISNKDLNEFVKSIELLGMIKEHSEDVEIEHFYPAFGGAASRQIKDLIIQTDNFVRSVNATWWFECSERNGELIVNNSLTTFNARNLTSPYWKSAIKHKRGVVVGTALGEGKNVNGKNIHYLMEGVTPILLGAVYKSYPNGLYSTAIITRDSHARFDEYHDKAFPLFLPPDPEFLRLWLSDAPETHPSIAELLEKPQVFNQLKVTPVKTLKGGNPTGPSTLLEPDKSAK
jgi:putative SOS response-associated peptidase YedK